MVKKVETLFEEFAKGQMDRRMFFSKLALFTGGATAAAALSPLINETMVQAAVVESTDPRLEAGYIEYPAETGSMRAHFARPKGEARLPGVIVIHENRGLQPQIEDVARRVALEGYLALAPDALSPLGGTPSDMDDARNKMRELDSEATIKNYVAAVEYLKTHPQSSGKVGCMGFCWGGGMTNQVAVNSADLTAAVPFYGRQPDVEDVPRIKAAMMMHYAGDDQRINAGIENFEAALKKAGVDYRIFMYEGAQHAFFNDSSSRYHPEAAALAWKRTLAFYKEKLKT